MKTSTFIASKIFSLSKENLSSTVMRLAVASVALGVAIMLISLSILIGFKNQIEDKVIGFVSPIHVQALNQNESLEETPFVCDSALKNRLDFHFIESYQQTAHKAGLLKTEDEIYPLVMKGVDENYNWDYITSYLIDGDVPQYCDTLRSNDVLLSKVIAEKMKLKVGDDVRIWFVDNDMKARGRKFNVKGIYETGLYECDERFIYCDLNQIRRLNGWKDNHVGRLEIWLTDENKIDEYNNLIYYSLPPSLISMTARETYPQIFDWLDLQDMNVVIIIVLMVLVAGITIISMLLIIILEKTSTVGLLKAMGADNGLIRSIFMRKSCRLLLIGILLGNFVGLALCLFQKYTGFIRLPAESYYLSSVPIELNIWYILLLNISAVLLWIFMLMLPTVLINNIRPSKSIRFE